MLDEIAYMISSFDSQGRIVLPANTSWRAQKHAWVGWHVKENCIYIAKMPGENILNQLNIDQKGRLSIPSHFREIVSGKFFVVANEDYIKLIEIKNQADEK